MQYIKIDPKDFPIKPGESWWIIHPNTANCEFRIPSGAATVCRESFYNVFNQNTVYNIVSQDKYNGWVYVEGKGNIYSMPEYLFARYFDAEVFIVGIAALNIETAKPFDYKPTLPHKPNKQLEFDFKG